MGRSSGIVNLDPAIFLQRFLELHQKALLICPLPWFVLSCVQFSLITYTNMVILLHFFKMDFLNNVHVGDGGGGGFLDYKAPHSRVQSI